MPRHVQLGEGDELLPVDLAAPRRRRGSGRSRSRVRDLAAARRRCVDRDGRRVEAVVMLVEAARRRDVAAHARRAAVDPRGRRRAAAARAPRDWTDWRTFKLFGARSRQDDLLALLLPGDPRRPARRRDRPLVLPALRRRARAAATTFGVRVHAAGDAALVALARSKAGCAIGSAPRARRRRDRHRDRRIPPRAGPLPRRRAGRRSTTCSNPTASSPAPCCRAPADPLEPDRACSCARWTRWRPGFGLDLDARHALAVSPPARRRGVRGARRRRSRARRRRLSPRGPRAARRAGRRRRRR